MVNRKRVSAVYLLLTIYASSVVPVHAAFEDTGTGARAAALGGAYAAVGTDSYSLMYNPAGLAPVRSTEVGTEYSRLFSGLSDNSNLTQVYLGFAQPLKNEQAIGVGIKQFSLQDLYKERVIALGYAKTISPGWSVGTVVKQLYHSVRDEGVSVDDNGNITSGSGSFFSQNGTSKSAYSFDLGMRYVPTDRHVVAVSMQDINEPNIALSESDHDIVPRRLRLAYAYFHPRQMILTGSLMVHEGLPNEQDSTWAGAGEKTWNVGVGRLAARGSLAVGSRRFYQLGTGVGYQVGGFIIDYAFLMNLSGVTIGSSAGTHRFSLTYQFGVKPGDETLYIVPDAKKQTTDYGYEEGSLESLLQN